MAAETIAVSQVFAKWQDGVWCLRAGDGPVGDACVRDIPGPTEGVMACGTIRLSAWIVRRHYGWAIARECLPMIRQALCNWSRIA